MLDNVKITLRKLYEEKLYEVKLYEENLIDRHHGKRLPLRKCLPVLFKHKKTECYQLLEVMFVISSYTVVCPVIQIHTTRYNEKRFYEYLSSFPCDFRKICSKFPFYNRDSF